MGRCAHQTAGRACTDASAVLLGQGSPSREALTQAAPSVVNVNCGSDEAVDTYCDCLLSTMPTLGPTVCEATDLKSARASTA